MAAYRGIGRPILLFAGVMSLGVAARAEQYPSKTVRFVVPQAAGGTTDVLARAIGERLSRKWGKPIVVENIAGAAGNIGTAVIAKAAPDGHTLLVTYEGS